MSALTKDELREFAEACGYKTDAEGWWHDPASEDADADGPIFHFPRFEFDVSAIIDALNAFCKVGTAEEIQWGIHRVDKTYNCWIEDLTREEFPEADGDTVCEAIIRAVRVAAKW